MPRSTGRPRAERKPATRPPARRKPATRARVLARLRAICLALPEAQERLSHGEPTAHPRLVARLAPPRPGVGSADRRRRLSRPCR